MSYVGASNKNIVMSLYVDCNPHSRLILQQRRTCISSRVTVHYLTITKEFLDEDIFGSFLLCGMTHDTAVHT